MRRNGAVKHLMRFGLAVVAASLLLVSSVAGAALLPASLTGYGGAGWAQAVRDGNAPDLDSTLSGMDINYVRSAYDGEYHYFQIEMYSANGGADYYGVYLENGPLPTGRAWWTKGDYYIGFHGDTTTLDTSNIPAGAVVAGARSGLYLEWKVKGIDLSPGFSWWAVTENDSLRVADFAVVPIPNAAWLLGSGLIGLIGLRRRVRK